MKAEELSNNGRRTTRRSDLAGRKKEAVLKLRCQKASGQRENTVPGAEA